MSRIEMNCSLPMVQSALKIGGDGSTRVTLEIPAIELPKVLRLATMTERELVVIVDEM